MRMVSSAHADERASRAVKRMAGARELRYRCAIREPSAALSGMTVLRENIC